MAHTIPPHLHARAMRWGGGDFPLPALDERTLTASRREFGGGLMEKGSQGGVRTQLDRAKGRERERG